jgi:hypothetical protein
MQHNTRFPQRPPHGRLQILSTPVGAACSAGAICSRRQSSHAKCRRPEPMASEPAEGPARTGSMFSGRGQRLSARTPILNKAQVDKGCTA